ncbi:MAG: matrixin family metalloprotease [Proteobacteria bacterium]|nr:MAG: matrixin family metalloprotease [Pseudomonadota bacterium]
MATLVGKYLGGVLGIGFIFSSFVACGTGLYKVSVKEDYDTSKMAAANPSSVDKTSTQYGIHAPQGWQKLPIPFRFDPKLNENQKIQLMAAMKRWEWATGKVLFSFDGDHVGVSGDTFKDLYSSLSDNVNGNYLDGDWKKTSKPDYVLATTIWSNGADYSTITKADLRFNEEYYVIGDSFEVKAEGTREVVDMQSLALHELGHLLGLGHVDEDVDSLSIMNPTLFIGEGLTTRKLAKTDIERIQQIYGCSGAACEVDKLFAEQEQKNWDSLALIAKQWVDNGTKVSPPLQLR